MKIVSILLLWRIIIISGSCYGAPIAKPNCTTHCGDVPIPYPFGIGPNKDCYLDEWFHIDCRHTNSTTSANYSRQVPFLKSVNLELLSISPVNEGVQSVMVKSPITFFSCEGKETRQPQNLTGSPFIYSSTENIFIAVSCGLYTTVRSDNTVAGCRSICGNTTGHNACLDGIDCCQYALPENEPTSAFSVEIPLNLSTSDPMGDCKYAFLVERGWFYLNFSDFRDMKDIGSSVPIVLDWILNAHDYGETFVGKTDQSANHSTPLCNNSTSLYMYNQTTIDRTTIICDCQLGTEGNPYLLQPCQDIDECKGSVNVCSGGVCENYFGGYRCYSNITGDTCLTFDSLDGIHNTTTTCHHFITTSGRASEIKTIILDLGSGVGLLLLLIGAWWVYKIVKKRKIIASKKMFFKRNGGLLLEQQLSSGKVNVDKIKLFNSEELEKSTNNFSIDRILGQGGQGTVYKGMLADGRIVAVKKSKMVDKSMLSEFINEVVILSQINHRNVVQIMGCCLETEVPLLVYEFIPNGTLSQYIQEEIEEFPLTWDMQLQIAIEVAGAVSYLHSAASFPIYHRDIKSANILLDEKYRAKIADFGTSRSISIDQTHLTTGVHGTFGYLDPEYFQSSQFTAKSDVYSFGVVLVELLTGQKPISAVTCSQEEEYRSLATYFITSMQEDRLLNVVDARVLEEGSETEIQVVTNLARRCLNLNGRNRPTMREVTSELEAVQMSRKPSISVEQSFQRVYFVDGQRLRYTRRIDPPFVFNKPCASHMVIILYRK